MKILILSNAFEHPYNNARLHNQCQDLYKKGHTVEVYTEPWDPLDFRHKYHIYELGERNTKYFKWLFLSIYSFLTNYKERKFAYQVMWHSRKSKFDLVVCSTNSCFPLGAAALVAKMKGLPLHVDIWDLEELSPTYVRYSWWHFFKALRQRVYIHRRNSALAKAKSVTTISPTYVETIKPINKHVEVLYNGFDSNLFDYNPVPTNTFRINYFGYSYSSQRTDMILRIMENIANEMPKVQLTFYSEEITFNHLKHAQPTICGILSKEIVADTMNQTSIVLLVNDTEDSGLNSDQFYQAVGAERPILFTGAKDGAIPDLIRLTQSGLATNNVEEATQFIRELYHQWEQDGYTHTTIANKDLFNLQLQSQHLEDTLLQLVTPQ